MTFFAGFPALLARTGRIASALALVALLGAQAAGAQELKPGVTITILTQRRRLNAAQPEAFTPFTTQQQRLRLDSIVLASQARSIWLSQSESSPSARLLASWTNAVVGANGRLFSLRATFDNYLTPQECGGPSPKRADEDRDGSSIDLTEQFDGLADFFAPQRRVAATIRATLARTAVAAASHSALRGIRVTRFLRDSVLRGMRLALVRDSAEVTLDDAMPYDAGLTESWDLLFFRTVEGWHAYQRPLWHTAGFCTT